MIDQPFIRSAILQPYSPPPLQGCTTHQCSEYILKATQAAFYPIGCTNSHTYPFHFRRGRGTRPSPLTWTANNHTPHLPRASTDPRPRNPHDKRHRSSQKPRHETEATPTSNPHTDPHHAGHGAIPGPTPRSLMEDYLNANKCTYAPHLTPPSK